MLKTSTASSTWRRRVQFSARLGLHSVVQVFVADFTMTTPPICLTNLQTSRPTAAHILERILSHD